MDKEIKRLEQAQREAIDYETWFTASKQLDSLLNFDAWKSRAESPLYDYETVATRLAQLQNARLSGNAQELLYLVRTTFSRNVGNMGDPRLYLKSHCGTKNLIETYISECEEAIAWLLQRSDIDDKVLVNTLLQTRKAFGRTALVLSGGATLGLLHAGVLFELHAQSLLPKIISGSSAGSIFASLVCTCADDDFDRLWELQNEEISIFTPRGETESMMARAKRFVTQGFWIDSTWLRDMMQELLGEMTFQEAYNKTGRILNVTVSASGLHDMPRLLNYLTAPNVLIWSAVCASCSVPFVFSSNTLMAKDPKTGTSYPWTKATFIDGSVDNDLPLARLAEMFNVNHFIACQVNPHVAPLLQLSEHLNGHSSSTRLDQGKTKQDIGNEKLVSTPWWETAKGVIVGEVSHALQLMNEAGLLRKATSTLLNVMAQEYIGNITILPRIEWHDLGNLFQNPTPEVAESATLRGREATWPKLAIVRNHCAIELALDSAIMELRARLIGRSGPLFGIAASAEAADAARTQRNHFRRRSEEIQLGRRHSSNSLRASPHGSATHLPLLRRQRSSAQVPSRAFHSPTLSPNTSRVSSSTNLAMQRHSMSVLERTKRPVVISLPTSNSSSTLSSPVVQVTPLQSSPVTPKTPVVAKRAKSQGQAIVYPLSLPPPPAR